jgi:hypothetical protein
MTELLKISPGIYGIKKAELGQEQPVCVGAYVLKYAPLRPCAAFG